MINPALKSALIRWQQTETAMRHAQVQCVSEEFVAWNSRRIAALEEIRKMVERGEFETAAPSAIKVLRGRKGFSDWWDNIEPDDQVEIVKELAR